MDLHLAYQAGITTIRKIVKEVCQIINERLKEDCMPLFSLARWEEIAEGFLTQANFPNCIGAIKVRRVWLIIR